MAWPNFFKKGKPDPSLIQEIGTGTRFEPSKDCVRVMIVYKKGSRNKGASDFFESLAKEFRQQVSFFSTDTSHPKLQDANEKLLPLFLIYKGDDIIHQLTYSNQQAAKNAFYICLENVLSKVIELKQMDNEQFQCNERGNKPVVLLLYKMYCPACIGANRVINRLADEYWKRIVFVRRRTSSKEELTGTFPNLLVFFGTPKKLQISVIGYSNSYLEQVEEVLKFVLGDSPLELPG